MGLLSRDDILNANDMVTEEVEVPEWALVLVKSLTGKERDEFENSIFSQKGKTMERNFRNLRAKLVALTIVNAEGKTLFTPKDISVLGDKNAAALDRVFAKAQRLSGLTKEDIEDMTATLEEDQSEDLPLD